MDDILFYSSLIFITNAIVAFYMKYYMYSFFFAMLTVTSMMVHSHKFDLLYTTLVDKFVIACIVFCGFYVFLEKVSPENALYCFLILLLLLSTATLYFYGFMVGDYCFHTDRHIATKYHCLMHTLSSAGNHIVTIL